MATYNKFQPWVEYMVEAANLQSDQFVVALTDTSPVNTYATLSQISQITNYANLSSRNITTNSSGQTGGTFSLALADLTMTASGTVGPFRYVVIYDDTVTSPSADPLVCWYDYGSSITMASGETFTIDFGANLFALT